MDYLQFFSSDYVTARDQFHSVVEAEGYHYESHSINQQGPVGEDLAIAVAIREFGKDPQSALVVSSGLHGVEGFLGSAVQLALLKDQLRLTSQLNGVRLVLIHALNPYGFAWRRRWNEDGVDLNRNFLLPREDYHGSPEAYSKLDSFFNPPSPPSRLEPFLLKALGLIARYGINSLKDTLPVGQYDFPKGLFFGGTAASKTQQILEADLARWLGGVRDVLHIDFHTGLGRRGSYKLLINKPEPGFLQRSRQQFGSQIVIDSSAENMVYRVRGSFADWCQAVFPHYRYDFITVEFGTYPVLQVVKALRNENRAYWWGKSGEQYEWTKRQLLEVFAPTSSIWRERGVEQGLQVIRGAYSAWTNL